jgi:ribonuclease HI
MISSNIAMASNSIRNSQSSYNCYDLFQCNTDGAATSVTSSCGGIFRNHRDDMICCFAQNTSTSSASAFHVELCGAMCAVEIAHSYNWKYLWMETDSTLVVKAFKADPLILWKLKNHWLNCNILLRNMNVIVPCI